MHDFHQWETDLLAYVLKAQRDPDVKVDLASSRPSRGPVPTEFNRLNKRARMDFFLISFVFLIEFALK